MNHVLENNFKGIKLSGAVIYSVSALFVCLLKPLLHHFKEFCRALFRDIFFKLAKTILIILRIRQNGSLEIKLLIFILMIVFVHCRFASANV